MTALAVPGTVEAFPNLIQRTDDWYQQRCGLITASAVGKLLTVRHLTAIEYACPDCGADAGAPCRSRSRKGAVNKTVHPERSAWAANHRDPNTRVIELADGDEARGVVTVAAAERITGFVDPTFVSYDMERGVEDEPCAVAAYSEHHAPVEACGFMVRTWGRCRFGYSPDGLVGDDGLVEVKSRRGRKQVETVLAGEVPAENVAQCQAALFVSGRAWLDFISYSAGMHLWTVRVTPDARWFEAIEAAVERFEDAVTATVTAYREAVKGLPMTERPLMDMVI